ncbi:phosphate uptake regulator PhoU [Candidatus Woesearchaeota archaeon]|nr:MAG: phosphate uptake regulator PhoU [Candidatus Woesearchaeota archaeon]
MKRKVIQLAGKTHVLSLPYKWVRKYNIKKGEELDMLEDGQKIIISTSSLQQLKKKDIDAKKLKIILARLIGAVYKAGFDEIEVRYENAEQYSSIKKCLDRTCIGMEIVEHGNNRVLIKNISLPQADQFDNVLRRLFLSLLAMADDGLDAATKKNEDALQELILRDDAINKYSDFCRRILNTKGTDSTMRAAPLYYIVEQLERIGDTYRDIALLLQEEFVVFSKPVNAWYQSVNTYLRSFYLLYYSFDLEKVERLGEQYLALEKSFDKVLKQATKKESIFVFYLKKILEDVWDMNGALLTAKL